MIQDIFPKKFKNEFISKEITPQSRVIIFEKRTVLIKRNSDNTLSLPTYAQLLEEDKVRVAQEKDLYQYVFSIDGEAFFLLKNFARDMTNDDISYWELPEFTYENISTLRQMTSKDVCFCVMSAYHLYVWYRDNQFCGRCSSVIQHDTKQRMLFCPKCQNMIFPKLAPAVIVGLVHGDKILMSKYADREYKKYALLAGFVEFGETVEDTVKREVYEEVGLHVKNIKYYKSQPWGIDSNVLLGYFAELDGDESVRIDYEELALAQWYSREEMPAYDDGISLTREMMGFFQDAQRFRKWYQI